MPFHVELTDEAIAETEEAYLWLHERTEEHAEGWYYGLLRAVDSLASHPERCSFAPESDAFPEPIRQLLYGKRRGVYRILFAIRGDTVFVLHIRHGARRPLEV